MQVPRIAIVEWPHNLVPAGPAWETIRRQVAAVQPDLLVTNEMPFGPWLASGAHFDRDAAAASVELHEVAIDALRTLDAGIVLSSRPIPGKHHLVNEAFFLDGPGYHAIHHKHYLPEEPGYFEASWFEVDGTGFDIVQMGPLRVGVLLCTELFFNEQARAYGKAGADLIVTPRASGTTFHTWRAAGALAAIVSGAYVVSSNRVGDAHGGHRFGGAGFAFTPEGMPIHETSSDHPLQIVDLDIGLARSQKAAFPCYVAELG